MKYFLLLTVVFVFGCTHSVTISNSAQVNLFYRFTEFDNFSDAKEYCDNPGSLVYLRPDNDYLIVPGDTKEWNTKKNYFVVFLRKTNIDSSKIISNLETQKSGISTLRYFIVDHFDIEYHSNNTYVFFPF